MLIKHSLNNMEYEHFMPFINSFHFCLLGSRKSGHSWLHSGFSLNFFFSETIPSTGWGNKYCVRNDTGVGHNCDKCLTIFSAPQMLCLKQACQVLY